LQSLRLPESVGITNPAVGITAFATAVRGLLSSHEPHDDQVGSRKGGSGGWHRWATTSVRCDHPPMIHWTFDAGHSPESSQAYVYGPVD
jgi:hypothetical protein